MKIVIIGSAHPLRGGLVAFNERLAELLQEGNEVVIYSFSLQYPRFLFPGKTQISDDPPPERLRIKSLVNSINPLNWLRVGKQIKRGKADLVIVKYWLPFMAPCFGTILRRATKGTATKVISILDNVNPHEKHLGDRALTKYFFRAVDGFIGMSKEVLADLRDFEPTKPALFSPHPIYDIYGAALPKKEARAKLGLAQEARYLLFFGFIRNYKGLDLLIEAIADRRLKEEGIHLIVAGEFYTDQKPYLESIERYGLHDRVHLFTEFIPNAEVKLYFSTADCVVQPYRSATQSGISQIAYHFEKPMIVTDVGGLSEIVKDETVGFVTEVEAGAIADAILRFYREGKEEAFIANAKEEKKKYSWNHFIENLLSLYKAIR